MHCGRGSSWQRPRDCQESCVRGHSEAAGGELWQSRRVHWTSYFRDAIPTRFFPRRREGSADLLISRFARVRVRAAHRDFDRSVPRDEEWLLVEWPTEEEKPTKFWLATLPENVAFDRLVALAKLRWRIERDYQELKQELGLGHFEGRGWRGFHHHATLCIAAYAFLVAERARIPPSEPTRLLAAT